MDQQGIIRRCTAIHYGDPPFRPITIARAWDLSCIKGRLYTHAPSFPRITHIPIATDGMGRVASIVAKENDVRASAWIIFMSIGSVDFSF